MQQRPTKLRRAPEDTGSVPLSAETNAATCQQADVSHGSQTTTEEPSLEKLPEDIVHHIHSFLHVQDAARTACVSRVFRRSWRCYSNLILSDDTLGLKGEGSEEGSDQFDDTLGFTDKELEEREIKLINKVGQILENHYDNGVKVERLSLNFSSYKNINASYLDRWLQITVKSGIEKLNLMLYPARDENCYSFPCSVLSDKAAASSVQSMFIMWCSFHPTSTLGCLNRLRSLDLSMVYITEEGLAHLLSKSFVLERLVLNRCSGINFLRIPCTLQQLKILHIETCEMTWMVEIDAPNLCTFYYRGDPFVEICVRNSSQLKDVNLWSYHTSPPGSLSYARATLPSIAPNVERLSMQSSKENVDIPMLPSKLIKLKKLEIGLRAPAEPFSPSYDVFSLVSFLDASPVLESFILWVEPDTLRQDPVVGDDEKFPRRKPECRHNSLRQVTITGFSSAKSLVEVTIHILESAPSLQRLMLDTALSYDVRFRCRASGGIEDQCVPMSETALAEAPKAVEVAGRYIAGRVPSGVEFQILGPCSRCHTGNL